MTERRARYTAATHAERPVAGQCGAEGPKTSTEPSSPESLRRIAQGRFVVTLPYPPSLNRLYRHVKNRTLLSEAGREYSENAGAIVAVAMQTQAIPPVPHVVTLLATPPDRRARDLDNLPKRLIDVMYEAFKTRHKHMNDSKIDRLVVEWRRDGRQACVEVIVETAA